MAFVRDGTGALVLRGYTVRRNGNMEAYWLQAPRGRRAVAPASLLTKAPSADTVWLAAAVTH